MTEEDKKFVFEMVEQVAKRKDIYLSIFIGPVSGTSITIYPYEEDETV